MRRTCAAIALLLVVGCSPSDDAGETTPVEPTVTTEAPEPTTTTVTAVDIDMGVSSPAFDDGSTIPAEYTCTGEDVSPQLDVVGLPPGTTSVAIIVDDPDAPLGTWDHWVEFDIEAGSGEFEFPRDASELGVEGINSWRLTGYMGPCPPEGEDHTYFFTIFALDASLELPTGVDSGALETAMTGHILDTAVLSGTFAR